MAIGNKKQHAINLRLEGYSLSHISSKIGVSRASLSHWLRDIPYTPNQSTVEYMKKARLNSAVTKSRRRIQSVGELKKTMAEELGPISDRDLLMMGLGLFMKSGRVTSGGAGRSGLSGSAVERIELSTADAKLARLFVLWIERGLTVPKEYIFVRLTILPSLDAERCRDFWSQVLKIPKGQIKIGSREVRTTRLAGNPKFSSAPFGSVKLYLKNHPATVEGADFVIRNGKNSLGVLLFRKIQAMVDAIASQ